MTETYFVQPHISQYDYSAYTRANGCTWTAGCNGIGAISGGRYLPSPDYLHSLLPKDQETNPFTAGWSIPDLDKALSKYGVTMDDRSGNGWADLIDQLEAGHYVVVQGRSSVFTSATCSGNFDGGHAEGINPKHRYADGVRWFWIDDGICPDGRWERESVLRKFAQALNFGIQYGSFVQRVPKVDTSPSVPSTGGGNVTIEYSQVTATAEKMQLPEGARLYASPGGKVLTRMSKAAAVPHVGLAGSVNGHPWRAVIVGTGVPYKDKQPRPTVLYVPASVGKRVAS